MGPITEHHLMLFLIQFALLLGFCKVLGRLFQRFNQSTVTAEILVGVIFGPALLGKVAPELHQMIFPNNDIQRSMLETVAWFGNFFLLLETGLEVNFSSIWKQKGQAAKLSSVDLVIPMILGFIPIYLLPDRYLVDPSQRFIFALFIAAIMTISALSVSIRGLRDLNILKSDMGFLIISALTMNDIVGWVVFTIILGIFEKGVVETSYVFQLIALTIAFTAISLTFLRRYVDKGMSYIHDKIGAETGYKTTYIVIIGMLMGALTLKIGIHSLFGFFIAGIILGEAKHASQKDRHFVKRMVNSIFVPIFFANIGLHLDFVQNFDWMLVTIMTVVGIFGRFVGAWIGAKWSKQDKANLAVIAICHTPGGEMHIVVGMLAYASGLITPTVFVAIIASAILSTVIFGPWLSVAVQKMHRDKLQIRFTEDLIFSEDKSESYEQLLRAMSIRVASQLKLDGGELYNQIIKREMQMSTATGKGFALPHAHLEGLKQSVIAVCKSKHGIAWDSPDDQDVHMAIMILTPIDTPKAQTQILGHLVPILRDPMKAAKLLESDDNSIIRECIESGLQACSNCRIV